MLRIALLITLLALVSACSDAETPDSGLPPIDRDEVDVEDDGERAPALVLRATRPFTGDWDALKDRKVLRVLVSHSRTNFFIAKGRIRGFECELIRELSKHMEKGRGKDEPPIKVAFIPRPFDQLIPSLLAGYGDIAAAALTITPDRAARVTFTDPYLTGVDQVLVAHRDAPAVTEWADLAGKRVHVVAGTSYAENLTQVNAELRKLGQDPIVVETFSRGIVTEDLLEMVSSGAIRYTVADRYLANLWAGVLPGLRIVPEVVAHAGGRLAWAVRPSNPKLKAMLDGFVAENREGTTIGNVLFKRYYGKTDWIRNPRFDLESGRLALYLPSLKKYCAQYDFDWRLIAAQAYQESGLDPNAVSSSGAVGLMQLLPSTAKDMGFTDLRDPDENLHAGIKYMDWLRKNFLSDPGLRPEAAADLALAAYNAGPGRVKRWRKEAPGLGLDPNRWFGNIERIALEDVGMQPVTYVGNINKYYILLTMLLREKETRETEREKLLPGK